MQIEIPYNWAPRDHYQMPAWEYLEAGGKRADLCWHRKSGKDLLALAHTAAQAIQVPGVYWHILPKYSQARKTVWDGRTNDGKSYLDVFGPEKGGIIAKKKENEMMLELINGSIWQIQGADEPDRLVGPNPRGVVFSEWSLMYLEIYQLTIQPILESNGGWAIFIYTPRGRNHAYEQRAIRKKSPGWFVQTLTINDTRDEEGKPIINEEQINRLRREGTPEALIQQEYYCSFDAPIRGAYYEKEMNRMLDEKRITQVPWEPRLEVHTCWDLGVNDSTVIWFLQEHGGQVRVIDCYANSGEGLPHYAKIVRDKPYLYGHHYAPHDITVREMGTASSRLDTARRLGLRFRVVPRHTLEDGIEATRSLLARCWIDEERCGKGIEALKGYRKEYNEEFKCYRDTPLHDWTSDYCDSLRQFAMGHRTPVDRRNMPTHAKTEYDIFSR